MPFVIAEPCVGVKDGSCVDVCPVDCIESSDEAPQYYIDVTRCIGCQACELYCPAEAIFSVWDLPEKWRSYLAANASFFVR